MSTYCQLNETETRYNLIDPLLENEGWNLADRRSVGFEIPVDGYDAFPINDITDYCLFGTTENLSGFFKREDLK